MSNLMKMLVICGPTAIGKSQVAVQCATRLSGEIIGADSQQIYADCAIGTAQIRPDEQRGVPHHLIGTRPPNMPCNAEAYTQAADRAVAGVTARQRVPIVVGGTGLYLRALAYGLCAAPPADAVIRATLTQRYDDEGGTVLLAELAAVDPELAAQIHPHHRSRVIRALEVWKLTGRSIRALQSAHQWTDPRYQICWIGLTAPRDWLRERIRTRINAQLAAGWIDEVRALVARYGADLPVLRAIGYRDILAWRAHEDSLTALAERIARATAQYAKRQMTYLRQVPGIRWIDVSTASMAQVVEEIIVQWTSFIAPV